MNPTVIIPVLAATDGTVDFKHVKAAFEPATQLDLIGIIDSEQRWASRNTQQHDALVLFTDGIDGTLVLRLAAEAVADGAGPVLIAARRPSALLFEQALAAGVEDVVTFSEAEQAGLEIEFAVRKALARRQAPITPRSGDGGQLVVVLGPKGGTGKTLTSANLATALAVAGSRVTLVDLDLQFGDLGLVLGLRPDKTIYDLAVSGGTLDAEKVLAFTCVHESGARVLLAPTRPDQSHVITPDFLRELYAVLREANDYVVVDTPPGFNAEVIATIDASSNVCLLGMLDAPSLKNAKLGLETLDLMGYPPERIRLVLNRADSNVGITHADVVHILGKAPDVLVPSTRDVVRSINAGEPVVMAKSRTEAGKAFQVLADLFLNETQGRSAVNAAPLTGSRR